MSIIDGKPFSDVLGEIEQGQFLRDITRELRTIVNAVRETRKPGAIKLALKISPTGKGSIEIDAKCDSTVPEHDRPSTVFFMTPDGTLVRDDPAQPRLPLVEVPRGSAEIKSVGDR